MLTDQMWLLSQPEAIGYELTILTSCQIHSFAKVRQNCFNGSRHVPIAEDCRMAAPRVVRQFIQTRHQAGPKGIEMNVAYQLQKIGFFFADDGLVAVLEQVAGSVMSKIEIDCIPGKEATHEAGKLQPVAPQQKMEMVRNQRPGVAIGFGVEQQPVKPFNKTSAIGIVEKYFCSLDPADDYMLQQARYVEAWLSGHGLNISLIKL